MARTIWSQAACSFLELPLAAGPVTATRMVPGDGDVYETLQEVPLRRRRLAPLVLQLLVRLEVGAGANQIAASLESHNGIISVRERC